MNSALQTDVACEYLERLKPLAKSGLQALNEGRFDVAQEAISALFPIVTSARAAIIAPKEDFLNDIFVLDRYIKFLAKYCELWDLICRQQFSRSWTSLQDGLDLLRLVKRFSSIDISFFEDQLTELEKTYPYNVFFSIAIAVKHFDCSLCQKDIDSLECPHRRGQLYMGEMAVAIAREITQVDHIAMVSHPEDKRCVVQFDDQAEQFKLVRLLSSMLVSKKMRIVDFSHLEFSKRNRPNPDFIKRGRNEICFCGSGKKFKYCCISKEFVEGDHVDLIAVPREIEAGFTW